MLSKNVFYQWFKQEVETRWKQHRFEWIEAGDWYWRLQGFDIETLTQAVRQHKACECYPTPNLKKVYEHAKTIRVNNRPKRHRGDPQGTSSPLPAEHVFIMCVAKDFDGGGPVGRYLPVLMWPFGKTTAEEYLRNAEAFARKHADFYGGVWEVFTDTNQLEIMIRRRELLAEQPAGISQ